MAAGADAPPPLTPEEAQGILINLSSVVGTNRWNSSTPVCSWTGIACTRSGSGSSLVVTNITLSNYGISNRSIFASICHIYTLLSLDLSRNSFTDLGDLFSTSSCRMKQGLLSLNLSSNKLSHRLSDLSGFPQLEVLDLSFNLFPSENLSAYLGSFPRLRSLNLSSNKLNGDIPVSMAGSLAELVLSGNHFSGSIPQALFTYGNLTLLDLSQNDLSGAVPDEFKSLPKLQTLLLSGNNLSGKIPLSLNVTTLTRFAANKNFFSGSIPTWITKHVRMLDLSYNNLNGSIPPDFLSHPGLQTVDLTSDMLEGTIPNSLSQSLFRLRLGGNKHGGNIPNSICDGMSLAYLELDNNQLMGNIPSELAKCKHLSLLSLASNQLEGRLPDGISNLEELVVLKLQNNSLNGHIPNTFPASLSTLNLSQNSFTGQIPSRVFELPKLSTLDLHGNNISGGIPISISSSKSLIELNLGYNALTGTIPTMATTLSTSLNLSHNYLSGSIPSNLGYLSELEILDLSYNNLSGEVPSSLGNMQSLTQLVLSYNHLSGSVPRFRQDVEIDIEGNADLINGTGNNNSTSTTGKKNPHNVVIIIFTIAGALVGLCVLAVIVMMSLSKRIYGVEDEGLSTGESVSQIINGHLITMNSIHTSAIDFMKAMEAVCNHQNIFLKTRFCTYYKAVMPNGSTYSVKKLNSSDKIFQNGNQEKFAREIEVLGKLTNSNVMVSLAYILTVDSAYLIYEHAYKGTVSDLLHGEKSDVIDWPSRSTGSFSTIAGTVGYIPPEYAYTMRLTMAGNVYSFGVILLELLTGKPSVSGGIELAKWALSLSARPDQREQILDTRVSGTSIAVHSQMLSVLNIALSCVAFSPDARPKMRNVLRMLFNSK
ncbi:leucine-rich repeat receptor-like tyrosine-protein kinase PXC3 [Panicum miliaceum]|uniref:Leucine-rich repeat receptor-like tyrosine-protein kinase PXC3 n=1 Tax=Panicum miliaceum TaxID=4540 RepID=A0A3L6T2B9_PANMI|nr:leucine-rich repeat receptor-like tyrosine-protein kinase PXC3 [Panicum miliaceum]